MVPAGGDNFVQFVGLIISELIFLVARQLDLIALNPVFNGLKDSEQALKQEKRNYQSQEGSKNIPAKFPKLHQY